MTSRFLRLRDRPRLNRYPTCGACAVELIIDSIDGRGRPGWLCMSCGSTWPLDAHSGAVGRLAKGLTGPVVPNSDARRYALLDPDTREDQLAATDR